MECPKTAAKDTFSLGARPLARNGLGCTGFLRKALLLLFPVVQTPFTSFKSFPSILLYVELPR